jgi:hypothetical protein
MATRLIIILGGGGKSPHGPVYYKLFQHPLNSHTMCAYDNDTNGIKSQTTIHWYGVPLIKLERRVLRNC